MIPPVFCGRVFARNLKTKVIEVILTEKSGKLTFT